jgi:hypothetical protein
MSLSKSKCWDSNICLHFKKRAVPLQLKVAAFVYTHHFFAESKMGQLFTRHNIPGSFIYNRRQPKFGLAEFSTLS